MMVTLVLLMVMDGRVMRVTPRMVLHTGLVVKRLLTLVMVSQLACAC